MDAFTLGNPAVAYKAVVELGREYIRLDNEAAKLRFQVNFGTQVCETCTGLHAGPEVAATCYQVKECRFGPVLTTDRRIRLASTLASHTQSSNQALRGEPGPQGHAAPQINPKPDGDPNV